MEKRQNVVDRRVKAWVKALTTGIEKKMGPHFSFAFREEGGFYGPTHPGYGTFESLLDVAEDPPECERRHGVRVARSSLETLSYASTCREVYVLLNLRVPQVEQKVSVLSRRV